VGEAGQSVWLELHETVRLHVKPTAPLAAMAVALAADSAAVLHASYAKGPSRDPRQAKHASVTINDKVIKIAA